MSVEKLIKKIDSVKNPTVVGLDPVLGKLPSFIKDSAAEQFGKTPKAAGEALFEFNRRIIDAVCDIVPAVKPQSAFYELYGAEGIIALEKTCAYAAMKGLYVILDAKRGDIGSTAAAYSSAFIGKTDLFGEHVSLSAADALTVNPYFGTDGLAPFMEDCKSYDKMIFILVKTSNPSSAELQDLVTADGRLIYEVMADRVTAWGEATVGESGYSNVGAVVGATHPEHLLKLRQAHPTTFFLVPGYGAQGGAANDIKGAFDKNGRGAIVNSSRGIIFAHAGKDESESFADYARQAAIKMRDDIASVIY